MKITLVCSSGLLIEGKTRSILIDAPNSACEPFKAFPKEEMERLLAAEPPYKAVTGLYFTHRHSDHCNTRWLKELLEKRPQLSVYIPDKDDPDEVSFGEEGSSFYLECHNFPHTPIPTLSPDGHVVMWLELDGKSIYISGDAAPDVAKHREILQGRKADIAFWNGQYLSYPETRQLMKDAAERSYIYHVPVDEPDMSGIRRRCHTSFKRLPEELSTVTLLENYPATI